jgi:uncharacterized coiled-coil protein SlyX
MVADGGLKLGVGKQDQTLSDLKAYILCRVADKSGIYSSWMNQCPFETVVLDEFLPDWHVPDDAGILITHMHYRWEELSTLRRIHAENRVPILILCDGILEYRNTWQHPDLVDGSIFQPVCGHKLACIGRGQARVIESWGNVGKCEVVGLPRLDAELAAQAPPVQTAGPFRLMIATANTPAFNDQQRQTVVKSLSAIKSRLEASPMIDGRQIQVTWRLSDGLGSELGVGSEDIENLPPISDVMNEVDAVITTPSTMYLESVLKNRPTAVLDFHNSPQYVTPAWPISHDQQFDEVLAELANPPAHKMLFQASVLRDQLECQSAAAPRMIELIEAMVAERQRSLDELKPLQFPNRILADPQFGFASVPAEFELESLYADNNVFANQELHRIQIELTAAIQRLEQLPLELAEKNAYIAQLNRAADRSRTRIETMHDRIIRLRTRFGVEPNTPPVAGREVRGEGDESE